MTGIFMKKALEADALTIYDLQVRSFGPLLDKYKDYQTNPAAETVERVKNRLREKNSRYYLIQNDNEIVGAVRIIIKAASYRISPVFILPEFQGRGFAQSALKQLEEMYTEHPVWELSTILQEEGNCYLYEKIGYVKTEKLQRINENMTLVEYKKER